MTTHLRFLLNAVLSTTLITTVGCAATTGDADDGTTGDDVTEATESPLAAPSSQYTNSNLDGCTLILEQPAYAKYDCNGLAPYRILVEDSDLRANVVVKSGSSEKSLRLGEVNLGTGFSYIGDKIEWRGEQVGGAFNPFAIVFRYTVAQNPSGSRQALIVSKLSATNSCIYKVIDANRHPDANELARQAADASRTAACPAVIPQPE